MTCSECPTDLNDAKWQSWNGEARKYRRRRLTCGPDCEKKRKVRLQRERRDAAEAERVAFRRMAWDRAQARARKKRSG